MNNEQWYRHRAEMSNYMPTMIAFKRKRSGWKRRVENLILLIAIVMYATTALGFMIYSAVKWSWNPALVLIAEVFITWHVANKVHEFVYDDDSGIHNLEGYDPETGTVPDLDAQGYDTSKFWYKKPPSRKR